jgi:hypothetical protein
MPDCGAGRPGLGKIWTIPESWLRDWRADGRFRSRASGTLSRVSDSGVVRPGLGGGRRIAEVSVRDFSAGGRLRSWRSGTFARAGHWTGV